MYCLVCFILLVSLEGLKADSTTEDQNTPTYDNSTTKINGTSPTISKTNYLSQEISSSPSKPIINPTTKVPTVSNTICTAKQEISIPTPDHSHCLFNIRNDKEKLLWAIILFLLVICLLLLVIMCFVCICCCQRGRKDYPVEKYSYATTKRNSVNGGPSETDIMLKDCSSVRVEIETTPDESQEPEEVGGAAAKVEDQVSGEEDKKSANDTSETAPTEEADQAIETEVKMEDMEKAV